MSNSETHKVFRENKATTSSVLIDWTSSRKRRNQAKKEQDISQDSDVIEFEEDPEVDETPFSFIKKARRCKLECCSPLWALASTENGHETLNLCENAIVFLPPPCEVSWFSGICSFKSNISINVAQEDEDPFMENNVHEVDDISSFGSNMRRIGILGHELEIDDCLKCADGGYQNFRYRVHLSCLFL